MSIVDLRVSWAEHVDDLKYLPCARLHEPFVLLRPVLEDSIEFLERRDSVAKDGVLETILVRRSMRREGMWEIIDGMWRWVASLRCGLETIPCHIIECTNEELLAYQIKANALRKETTQMEYSRQLRRILNACPMSAAKLAKYVNKHVKWIRDQLLLNALMTETQLMVDRGEIPVLSAYRLAKLPHRFHAEYTQMARTMPAKEFVRLAAAKLKQYKEAVKKGQEDLKLLPDFQPMPNLRSITEIRHELAHHEAAGIILVAENCKTLLDAWDAHARWVLHTDHQSTEEQRQRREKEERQRIEREAHNDLPLD